MKKIKLQRNVWIAGFNYDSYNYEPKKVNRKLIDEIKTLFYYSKIDAQIACDGLNSL